MEHNQQIRILLSEKAALAQQRNAALDQVASMAAALSLADTTVKALQEQIARLQKEKAEPQEPFKIRAVEKSEATA